MHHSRLGFVSLVSSVIVAVTLGFGAHCSAAAAAVALWGDEEHFECRHARLAALALQPQAGQEGSFDPETGRNLLNYPPHRHVDYEHMRLEMTIPDMSVPRARAIQRLILTPIAYPLEDLSLNAELLEIASVRVEGRETRFEHDGHRLRVEFSPPVEPGESITLVTEYAIEDPPFGLIWTPESAAWPGRPAQLHTQGQPEDNRYWFPMHDFPNERLTTELVVAVPDGFQVSSNGRLVERWDGWFGEKPMDVYHWLQDKPHVSYLVSLIAGKFEVVDVGSAGLPMPVYVPPGRGADVPGTYGMTDEMNALYERLFDEPYPWDRYAQLVVWNFAAGGMENTAATTMFDTAIISREAQEEYDLMGLISHELAHQWFGDMLTCNSWEHIWLNEGFATYLESLWWEERDGPDGYQADTVANFDRVIAADRAEAPARPGMANKAYGRPIDVFRRAANPYPKGASVLHMLRAELGDDLFFEALRAYLDRYALGTVRTEDLRRTLEEVTGESLERFFDQWVFRPGVPRLGIDVAWNPYREELEIAIAQNQNIDPDNPAFAFELPVLVQLPDGSERRAVLEMERRERTFQLHLPAEPFRVVVDPEMTVLAELDIDQPERRWIHQLADGPTLYARVQAARHLAGFGSSASTRKLLELARDGDQHHVVRSACIEALAERGDAEALDAMARDTLNPSRVRAALVEAVGRVVREREGADLDLTPHLLAWARDPGSQRVRAAAVEALGELGDPAHIDLVVAAAGVDSQFDAIRRNALEALAALDDPAGLDTAIRYARPGALSRTRATAIRAVGALGHHDPARAYAIIEPMLGDRVERVVRAAGDALVEIGDPDAIGAFDRFAAQARDERWRAWAADQIAKLETRVGRR